VVCRVTRQDINEYAEDFPESILNQMRWDIGMHFRQPFFLLNENTIEKILWKTQFLNLVNLTAFLLSQILTTLKIFFSFPIYARECRIEEEKDFYVLLRSENETLIKQLTPLVLCVVILFNLEFCHYRLGSWEMAHLFVWVYPEI